MWLIKSKILKVKRRRKPRRSRKLPRKRMFRPTSRARKSRGLKV